MCVDWITHQTVLLESSKSPFISLEWRARLHDDDYISQFTERIASTNKQGTFFTTVVVSLHKIGSACLVRFYPQTIDADVVSSQKETAYKLLLEIEEVEIEEVEIEEAAENPPHRCS
jgi:hypothetical protein